MTAEIIQVAGPVIHVKGLNNPKQNNLILVGNDEILGEIIQIKEDKCIVQVYQDTSGVGIHEPVKQLNTSFVVKLGPGMVGTVFDGIQRRLDVMDSVFVTRGVSSARLDKEKRYPYSASDTLKIGDIVNGGEIIGECIETDQITHKIMVPPNIKGKIAEINKPKKIGVDDVLVVLEEGTEIKTSQEWNIRKPRPYVSSELDTDPLITGQRVLDFLFPIAKGGTAAIPGGFGTGKTVLERTLAKYATADLMVLILCGERGNETTHALNTFLNLEDPRTGKPMIDRTIIIANTSNMPVAARESSIHFGVTVAEYYRDMGLDVVLLADSTSRWAEALRELSGRLGEISVERGYPAYLPNEIANFYERAGGVTTLSGQKGSITTMGAVSPPGGDFSEPVTQFSMRFSTTFWALDTGLARSRHFPAISWKDSYTDDQIIEDIDQYFNENISKEWVNARREVSRYLKEEEDLQQIVQLIGKDTLSEKQRELLLIVDLIKTGFLQQNALTEDAFSPPEKTYQIIRCLLKAHNQFKEKISEGLSVNEIEGLSLVNDLRRLKEKSTEDISDFYGNLENQLNTSLEESA